MWESIAMALLFCRTHTWLPKCGDRSGFLRLSFIGSWLVLHNDLWRSDPPLLFPLLARLPLDKYLCNSRPPNLIDLCVLNIWLAIPPCHPQKCAIQSELACESHQGGEEHLKYGAHIDKNTRREYTVHCAGCFTLHYPETTLNIINLKPNISACVDWSHFYVQRPDCTTCMC